MSHPLTFTATRRDFDALLSNLNRHWPFQPIALVTAISSSALPDGRVKFGLSEQYAMAIVNDLPPADNALPLILEIERALIQRTEPVVLRWPSDQDFHSSVA